ncbi:MAG TPA: ThuA domain-containing protein [Spongiibacteraceae bacterium]|nr:ThuA domain-containing protein [Spongiibacteraceae bacterium]
MKKWLLRIFLGLVVIALGIGAFYYKTMRDIGFFRDPVFETERPTVPALTQPAILVFSKTNSFIHKEAIPAAKVELQQLAKKNGWSVYLTDSGAIHNAEDLAKFKTVIWNNVTGDVLTESQRTAFQNYIEQGGGFVALHGAGDGSIGKNWPWYTDKLIGAEFIGHPMKQQFQVATVHVEDRSDPITDGLDENWSRTDEWYSFASSPRSKGFHILATLDENSYSPEGLWGKSVRMGADHPIIWKHCVGRGRVFYSAMGHTASSYEEPKYQAVLTHAIAWAIGQEGPDCVSMQLKPEAENKP